MFRSFKSYSVRRFIGYILAQQFDPAKNFKAFSRTVIHKLWTKTHVFNLFLTGTVNWFDSENVGKYLYCVIVDKHSIKILYVDSKPNLKLKSSGIRCVSLLLQYSVRPLGKVCHGQNMIFPKSQKRHKRELWEVTAVCKSTKRWGH